MSTAMPQKVFLSYAHEDEVHRETLGKHLCALEREGLIAIWHDRMISGGREWAGAIDNALTSSDIVLLLISADFLDSDYCNDVELTEAIRMHDAGRARVVPVILRSCDWEHSKFARFNALPLDGLPAVEAEHPDQRFNQIAKGLRTVATELRGTGGVTPTGSAQVEHPDVHSEPQPESSKKLVVRNIRFFGIVEIGPFELPWPPRFGWRTPVNSLLALLGAGLITYHFAFRGPLAEAQDAMRIGRYDSALGAVRKVPQWLSWSPPIKFMRDKAELGIGYFQPKPNWEGLGKKLHDQRAARPDDADLLVLDATYWVRHEDYDKARALLQAAVKEDPTYAEAWYQLGLDRDMAGDSKGAEIYYRKALTVAPDSPQYRSNLARLLLDDGQFDKAINEYRKVNQFPLARLEQALGHWAKGEFGEALGAQKDALAMLGDEELMNSYSNRRMWQFPIPLVQLPKLEDRRCYALLGEAASGRLAGQPHVTFPPTECFTPHVEIRKLIANDLCRFVDLPQPKYSERANALRLALGQSETCRN